MKSDNISRQAAAEAIQHHFNPTGEELPVGLASVLAGVGVVIATMPSTDNWIPCSERLPRKNGKYLCCWQGASVGTGMFLNGHFRLYGEIKDNLVTAWMPLPEAYKGGAE